MRSFSVTSYRPNHAPIQQNTFMHIYIYIYQKCNEVRRGGGRECERWSGWGYSCGVWAVVDATVRFFSVVYRLLFFRLFFLLSTEALDHIEFISRLCRKPPECAHIPECRNLTSRHTRSSPQHARVVPTTQQRPAPIPSFQLLYVPV